MLYLRTSLILLMAGIAVIGAGCKKHHDGPLIVEPDHPKVVVTTIAGNGTDGYVNGDALSAEFETPTDVTVGPGGVLYIADYNTHRVRKLAGGQVTTLAGNSTAGFLNGNGENAEFSDPYRIVSDAAGNCYLMDQVDARVRRITPAADVTTYAGRSTSGFMDGDTSVAKFVVNANGEAIDLQGNVYVGDTFNQRIRKISTTGQVSTLAGNGTRGYVEGDPQTAQFNYPAGIAADNQGNIYVADAGNFAVRKITPAGQVSTLAGGTQGTNDGTGSAAQFNGLVDVVVDSHGNVFLGEQYRIRKITPQGVVTTIAGDITGGFADGQGMNAKFGYIGGLGIDSQGTIYVADAANNRIRKVSFE